MFDTNIQKKIPLAMNNKKNQLPGNKFNTKM